MPTLQANFFSTCSLWDTIRKKYLLQGLPARSSKGEKFFSRNLKRRDKRRKNQEKFITELKLREISKTHVVFLSKLTEISRGSVHDLIFFE